MQWNLNNTLISINCWGAEILKYSPIFLYILHFVFSDFFFQNNFNHFYTFVPSSLQIKFSEVKHQTKYTYKQSNTFSLPLQPPFTTVIVSATSRRHHPLSFLLLLYHNLIVFSLVCCCKKIITSWINRFLPLFSHLPHTFLLPQKLIAASNNLETTLG
jgi:hypothetical protein